MTQPTLSVLDSSGTPRVINTANPNGQTTAANSLPVVLASDQALPLPAGAATNASLVAIGNTQHADLVDLLAAIGVTNAGVASLTTAQHADLLALLAKVPVLPTGSNEVDRSGTIATANTAQTIMAANAARKYFELQNLDATNALHFRKDGNPAVIGAIGTFVLMAGALYSGQATGSVSVASTAAGHKFSAVEVG